MINLKKIKPMQESQHTEFKRHWKDDYLKWICAFANSNGGTLMIGYKTVGINKKYNKGKNNEI